MQFPVCVRYVCYNIRLPYLLLMRRHGAERLAGRSVNGRSPPGLPLSRLSTSPVCMELFYSIDIALRHRLKDIYAHILNWPARKQNCTIVNRLSSIWTIWRRIRNQESGRFYLWPLVAYTYIHTVIHFMITFLHLSVIIVYWSAYDI